MNIGAASVIDSLISDIHKYRKESSNGVTSKTQTRTIKDFSHIKGAVKIELCASDIDTISVTYITGDTWGVLGMGKNELIGRNMLKLGKMTREYVSKVLTELDEYGFVFKEMTFKGRKINSILILREGNNLVEIAWVRDAIK